MTPDELAAVGRALYGDRWQTQIASDLGVADRTVRRWVANETSIPDGIASDLRSLLTRRTAEIGDIVSYTVDVPNRAIFHARLGAFFRYDDDNKVTLVHPGLAVETEIPLLQAGAVEALAGELGRDPSVRFLWLDRVALPEGEP